MLYIYSFLQCPFKFSLAFFSILLNSLNPISSSVIENFKSMNFPLIIVFDNIPRMISFCYFPYILHSHLIFHFGKSFHFDISKFCNVLFLCWFISFTRKFSHALFLLGLFLFLLNAPFLFSACLTFHLTILRVFRLCSTSLVSSTNIIVYST